MTELDRFHRLCDEILRLRLERFQLRIVREVFSDRREALILLPCGNGKSRLLAAIALWHLLSAKEPRIAIGAASREQAAVLFDIARGMASHPAIAGRIDITRREIRTHGGWLKVVASDGPKQHASSSASRLGTSCTPTETPSSYRLTDGDAETQGRPHCDHF